MIYDISQPVFECEVFPGDPKPEKTELMQMDNGDPYNLTAFSMCAHNGTHVDAPRHFINDGKSIDQIDLVRFIGPACVVAHNGEVSEEGAKLILERAKEASAQAVDGKRPASPDNSQAWKKILVKGDATITLAAAEYFADAGIELIGNESMSVGPEDAPEAVHHALLAKEVVLLEGIRLLHVPEGVYLLNCAPLNLTGAEGSPCRATLVG